MYLEAIMDIALVAVCLIGLAKLLNWIDNRKDIEKDGA